MTTIQATIAKRYMTKRKRNAPRNWLWRMVRRSRCFFGNHDYQVTQQMSERSRRIACPHCGGMWEMNDDVRVVVDWSAEMHRMYERHMKTPVVYKSWEGKPNVEIRHANPKN